MSYSLIDSYSATLYLYLLFNSIDYFYFWLFNNVTYSLWDFILFFNSVVLIPNSKLSYLLVASIEDLTALYSLFIKVIDFYCYLIISIYLFISSDAFIRSAITDFFNTSISLLNEFIICFWSFIYIYCLIMCSRRSLINVSLSISILFNVLSLFSWIFYWSFIEFMY